MTKILTTQTLLPSYQYSAAEALPYYQQWISKQPKSFQDKALKIFEHVAIEEKHSIAPGDVLFQERTIEESNNLYREKALELSERVLREALQKANLQPTDLDFILTTSCTGFMIPSMESYLIDTIGLRQDIKQLPITEIGCTAGATALIYANDFLKAYPDKKAAIITLEFPTNTIQLNDFSWDNLVSVALFGDGVACAILGNDDKPFPQIVDTQMYHVRQTTNILGYNLTNSGFKINLDKIIPETIQKNFEQIVVPFLHKNHLSLNDIDHYLIHPGGLKILEMIEEILKPHGKNVALSRKIMKQYGNMSSSTILFILTEYLKTSHTGEKALLMSFGPGFSAHMVLLEC